MRACRIPYGYKINPDWKHAFDPLISASAVDIAAFCGDSDGRYAYKVAQAPVSYQDWFYCRTGAAGAQRDGFSSDIGPKTPVYRLEGHQNPLYSYLKAMPGPSVSSSRLCHHYIRLIDFMVRLEPWNRIRSNLDRVKPIKLRGEGLDKPTKRTKLHLHANALMIADQNPVKSSFRKKTKKLVFIKILLSEKSSFSYELAKLDFASCTV